MTSKINNNFINYKYYNFKEHIKVIIIIIIKYFQSHNM